MTRAGCTRPMPVWSTRQGQCGPPRTRPAPRGSRSAIGFRSARSIRGISGRGRHRRWGLQRGTDGHRCRGLDERIPATLRYPLAVDRHPGAGHLLRHAQPREFAPDRFPIWIWRAPEEFYGFPIYGEVATKAGQDVGGEAVRGDADVRTRIPHQTRASSASWRRIFPVFLVRSSTPRRASTRCRRIATSYRRVPGHPHITVAVDAGHAFKFATLLGRILSELALDGQTELSDRRIRGDRPALTDPTFQPVFRNEAVLNRSLTKRDRGDAGLQVEDRSWVT